MRKPEAEGSCGLDIHIGYIQEDTVRKRINISVTEDTEERLKQYAWEQHKNVSQAITDWIWTAKVKNGQIRGQQSINSRSAEKNAGNR